MSKDEILNLILGVAGIVLLLALLVYVYAWEYAKKYEQNEGVWFETVRRFSEVLGIRQPVVGIYPRASHDQVSQLGRICLTPRLIEKLGVERVQALIGSEMCMREMYSAKDLLADTLAYSVCILGSVILMAADIVQTSHDWLKSMAATHGVVGYIALMLLFLAPLIVYLAYCSSRMVKRYVKADKMAAEKFTDLETILAALQEWDALRRMKGTGSYEFGWNLPFFILNKRIAALKELVQQNANPPSHISPRVPSA